MYRRAETMDPGSAAHRCRVAQHPGNNTSRFAQHPGDAIAPSAQAVAQWSHADEIKVLELCMISSGHGSALIARRAWV